MAAFAYVIYSERMRLVKIGHSIHPTKRLSELKREDATLTLEYYEWFPHVGWARGVEEFAQGKLYLYRHHGEWFNTSVEVAIGYLAWLTDRVYSNNRLPRVNELIAEGWLINERHWKIFNGKTDR